MTDLHAIERIKKLRQEKAERALMAQRAALAAANEERERAGRTWVDWKSQADAAEISLYDGLMRRSVKVADIDDVQLSMVGMRTRQHELHDSLEERKAAAVNALKTLDTRRDEHSACWRAVEKMSEIVGEAGKLASAVAEAAAENDIDLAGKAAIGMAAIAVADAAQA